ncbi:MAG: glycosyltransferase [Pseudobdellovibrio sp.]
MTSESSPNYYYRYKVINELDLSIETAQRRLRKVAQNATRTLLLDLSETTANIASKDFPKKLYSDYAIEKLYSISVFLELPLANEPLNTAIHIQVIHFSELVLLDRYLSEQKFTFPIHIHLSPRTKENLYSFYDKFTPLNYKFYKHYFWDFRPYNSKLKNSLTIKDIGQFFKKNYTQKITHCFIGGALNGLEIWNDQIPNHYELEPNVQIEWQFATLQKNIQLSIIIPTFNNLKFLSNVISHLISQNTNSENYEIIIVEDGGSDESCELIKILFQNFNQKINLKFIYWSKSHPVKGEQKFFRAGLARNLGTQYAESEYFVFLDSDMLVPENFIELCINELTNNDLIQFQRYHIHQNLSTSNPSYSQINISADTYVEEKNYWTTLFNCSDWKDLENYWKYTCTYALGIKKSEFLKIGRFKKYYISYGFEDTDIGYELFKKNKKFKLVPTALYHLTAYDQMQYRNSQMKRMQLLRKTSALFYLQHLDKHIFETFENFYRFEKSLINRLKELL